VSVSVVLAVDGVQEVESFKINYLKDTLFETASTSAVAQSV
jgi:hypothetical protein